VCLQLSWLRMLSATQVYLSEQGEAHRPERPWLPYRWHAQLLTFLVMGKPNVRSQVHGCVGGKIAGNIGMLIIYLLAFV